MSLIPVHIRAALSALLAGSCVMLPVAAASSSESHTDSSYERHCGALSPRLVVMGDDYFDLDAPSRNEPDTPIAGQLSDEALRAALQSERFSFGQGQRTACFGSGDRLHSRSTSTTLHDIESRMQIASHHGENHHPQHDTVIKAYEYDEQQRRSRAEWITVPSSAVAIETFSGVLISSLHRQRQHTPKGSYLRETELTALRTADELIIEQNLYVNGTLAEWNTWTLIPQGS